jgi:integral membrane sensor domain MASE1
MDNRLFDAVAAAFLGAVIGAVIGTVLVLTFP